MSRKLVEMTVLSQGSADINPKHLRLLEQKSLEFCCCNLGAKATLRGSAFAWQRVTVITSPQPRLVEADGKLAPTADVKGVWPPAPCMAKVRGLN